MAENTHEIVAMIIPFMTPHPNLNLVVSGIARSLEKCLRVELVEEIICSSLEAPSAYQRAGSQRVHLPNAGIEKMHT